MKTRAFALLALAVALGGCRENLGSIASHGFCGPPDNDTCQADETCGTFVSYPFQVSFGQTNEIVTWMEWENRLTDNGGGDRLNTNDFYLQGYEYQFSAPFPLPDAIATYRTHFVNEVWIPAGGSRNVPTSILPSDVGDFLDTEMFVRGLPFADVAVKIKALGRLGDDGYYETGEVQAAIEAFRAPFAYGCPKPDEVVIGVCPQVGQGPVNVICAAP